MVFSLLSCLLCLCLFHQSAGDPLPEKPKLWALLVAGSDGWWNYRHQADVCHAYQILHAHGIPDENIVVMMKDDIANNTENPLKGVIINHPKGPDVYKGVPKDYTGEDVTPDNFINILTGNKEAMKNIGSGKVIESGPNDHVFVNFVDHGAVGIVGFPLGELTAKELNDALKKMHEEKRYNKTVLYVEACEAGSMFEDILPNDISIFATTAANSEESSWGCYCEAELDTCLGDHYSVTWMEDSDKVQLYMEHFLQESLEKEKLQDQYQIVKKLVNDSHVMEYGDLSIGKLVVGEFQGEAEANTTELPKVSKDLRIPSREIPMYMLYRKLKLAKTEEEKEKAQLQIQRMIEKRGHLETTVKKILGRVALSADHNQRLLSMKPVKISRLDCHHELVKAFSTYCFNFGKNPFALNYAHVLANMCNDGLNPKDIIEAMEKECRNTLKERIE